MLAKLFGNISIPALVIGLFTSLATLIVTLFFMPVQEYSLQIAGTEFIWPFWIYATVLVMVVLFGGLWLSNVINGLEMLKGNYHSLPLFTWMFLPFAISAGPGMLISLPLIIFIFMRLVSLAGPGRLDYVMFDTGVFAGILMLVVPESLVFIILAWISILVFRTVFFQALLMPVIGVIAIWFLLFAIFYFAIGSNLITVFLQQLKSLDWEFSLPPTGFNPWALLPVSLVLLPASLELLQLYAKANVFKKQVFNFLIFFMLAFLTLIFFVHHADYVMAWLSIPFTILVVNLIIYLKKGWKKDLAYLGIFLFWLLAIFP